VGADGVGVEAAEAGPGGAGGDAEEADGDAVVPEFVASRQKPFCQGDREKGGGEPAEVAEDEEEEGDEGGDEEDLGDGAGTFVAEGPRGPREDFGSRGGLRRGQ
jgi:hypothetical protein